MKKYAYILDGRVNQFVYAFSETFPELSLGEIFAKEIVQNCVEVNVDNKSIKEGMDYNSETGVFSEHIEEEVIEEVVEDVAEEDKHSSALL